MVSLSIRERNNILATSKDILQLRPHDKVVDCLGDNARVMLDICEWIWENPPYGIRARFAQCAFLVAQVQISQSPDFVIYIYNPSSNCYRLLRRLVVLYEGEISLQFDPPSRHSHRTRSPLLWAVIRILYLDTARFNRLYKVGTGTMMGHRPLRTPIGPKIGPPQKKDKLPQLGLEPQISRLPGEYATVTPP